MTNYHRIVKRVERIQDEMDGTKKELDATRQGSKKWKSLKIYMAALECDYWMCNVQSEVIDIPREYVYKCLGIKRYSENTMTAFKDDLSSRYIILINLPDFFEEEKDIRFQKVHLCPDGLKKINQSRLWNDLFLKRIKMK